MIWRLFRRLAGSNRGGAMVEAAVVLPIIIMLLLAGFEIARLTLLHQKLDRAVSSMADLVSQSQDLNQTQLTDMFNSIAHIMEPFEMGGKGKVIVTSIGRQGSDPTTIFWQQSGAGTLSVTSQVGTAGGTPTLPTGFVVRPGEGLIIAEVYYDYSPFIFWDIVTAKQLYHRAYFRPRYGKIASVIP
jgi:Flp pilus assembly protein TadG